MSEGGAYQTLEKRFKRLGVLGGVERILDWDSQTMMPAGGAADRAEQSAAIALIRHEILNHPSLGDLLDQADDDALTDPWQAANLAEMRRLWVHANAVDARLVEAMSKASAASEMCWREARPANDFAGFSGPMGEVLALVRESAAAKAEALGCSSYDALLDSFEPHGNSAHIDQMFDRLADFLPGFLAQVIERQASEPAPLPLEGPFPIDAQRALGRRMIEAVGFDFDHGRLDESNHPFTGGTGFAATPKTSDRMDLAVRWLPREKRFRQGSDTCLQDNRAVGNRRLAHMDVLSASNRDVARKTTAREVAVVGGSKSHYSGGGLIPPLARLISRMNSLLHNLAGAFKSHGKLV